MLHEKKISELFEYAYHESMPEENRKIIETILSQLYKREREWAIAVVKWLNSPHLDDGDPLVDYKKRFVSNFLIDRFEIKPEELE